MSFSTHYSTFSVPDVQGITNGNHFKNTIVSAKKLNDLNAKEAKTDKEINEINQKLKIYNLDNVPIEQAKKILAEKNLEIQKKEADLSLRVDQFETQKNNLIEKKKENDNKLKEKIDTKFSQIFGEKPAQNETVSFIIPNKEKARLDLLMDPFVDFLKNHPEFTKINLTPFKEEIEDKDIQKLANFILFDKNTLKTVIVTEGQLSRKITISNLPKDISKDQKDQLETFALAKLTFNDVKTLAKAIFDKTIDIRPPLKK